MALYEGKSEFCPDCSSASHSSCATCMIKKGEEEADMRARLRKLTGKDNNISPYAEVEDKKKSKK